MLDKELSLESVQLMTDMTRHELTDKENELLMEALHGSVDKLIDIQTSLEARMDDDTTIYPYVLALDTMIESELSVESKTSDVLDVIGITLVKVFKAIIKAIKDIIIRIFKLIKEVAKYIKNASKMISKIINRVENVSKNNTDGQFADSKDDSMSFTLDEIENNLSLESSDISEFPTPSNILGSSVSKLGKNTFAGKPRPVIKIPTAIVRSVTTGSQDTCANIRSVILTSELFLDTYLNVLIDSFKATERYAYIASKSLSAFEMEIDKAAENDVTDKVRQLSSVVHNDIRDELTKGKMRSAAALPNGMRLMYPTDTIFGDKIRYSVNVVTDINSVYRGDGYARLSVPSDMVKLAKLIENIDEFINRKLNDVYERTMKRTDSFSKDVERVFSKILNLPDSDSKKELYRAWKQYYAGEALSHAHLTQMQSNYKYAIKTMVNLTKYLSYHLVTYERSKG